MSNKSLSERLLRISEEETKLAIEKELQIQKALKSDNIDDIFKAYQYINSSTTQNKQVRGLSGRDESPIKTVLVDPLDLNTSLGYRNKSFSISYDILRAMARTHIVKAIIETRKTQVSAYCQPQADKYSPGFVVQSRKKYTQFNSNDELTSSQKKRIDDIVEFLLQGGNTDNYWEAESFDVFVGKLVADSLTLDQATAEIIRDNSGVPCEFKAVDAATIRRADTFADDFETNHEKIKGYYPSLVQVINGSVVTDYYPWEMMFGIRNPSTDIKSNGYGRSELEDMIQTVTALLNADYYNSNFFKVGSAPKGILKYSGDINMNVIEQFKSQWRAETAGVLNMHKIPLMNAEKLDFINLQQSNKDMEFSKYQEFLIKITCALYKIDPSEIGFPMAGASETSAFNGSVGNAEKLKYSKDKGLMPLLKYIERWINKYIVWQIDKNYEFRFVGLDNSITYEEELNNVVKEIQNFKTVNEVRKQMGLSPIKNGDIVCNPIMFQQMMAQQQQEMMQQQQEGGNPFEEMFGFEEEEVEGEEETNPLDEENPLTKGLMDEIGVMLSSESSLN